MSDHTNLVTLVGGHHDGEQIGVEPTRLKLVQTYDLGERFYEAGEWALETSEPFVTKVVGFELYERVDDETFRAVAS